MPLSHSTPRYTGVVRPETGMPAAAGGDVIPLHGATPPRPSPPVPHYGRTAPLRRPRVPVDRRPWRVLLVPPTPGARTRTFALARWHARALLSGLVVLLLLATGAVTAVIVALERPDLMASSVEVDALRDRLAVVEDSLDLARAVLADDTTPAAEASPVASSTLPPGARKTAPLLARVLSRAHARSLRPRPAMVDIEGLPVLGAIVSGFTNARRHPILHVVRPHLGIDIAAVRGARVTAPAAGRVTYVGRKFALGLTLEIAHAEGVSTRYAHLRTALVHEGQEVTRGATIATVGSSGLTTGPHLHYEVSVNGRPVDPVTFRMPRLGDSTFAAPVLPGAGAPAAKDESLPQPR